MGRRTKLASLIVLLGAAGISPAALSVTYEYTGNPFTQIVSNSPNVAGSYTTSMFVSGSFDVASPLAGGLTNQNIDALILGFSFSDGRTTLTNATSGITFDFVIWTDVSGSISDWNILLTTPQSSSSIAMDYLIETCSGCGSGPSARDRGRIRQWQGAGLPRYTDEAIGKDAGEWEMASVPEPGTLALLGLGLLGLGVTRRKAA